MARKTFNERPELGWLRELREAGDMMRQHTDRELELLARRSKLFELVAGVERDIAALRDRANDDAVTQWTRAEIVDAKRQHSRVAGG